jgi:hypothetical protein
VDYSGNKSAFTSGVSATTEYLGDDFENGVRQLFLDQGLDIIEPVSSLPASGDFTGQQVFLTTDSKLYSWNGSSWNAIVGGAESFSELTGSIAQSQIPNGTIDSAQLADDAVIAAKISANAVGANAIAANSITGGKIVANTITGGLLDTSGIITSAAQINDAVITNAKIANLAVSTAKVANNAITFPTSATGTSSVFLNSSNGEYTAVSLTVNASGAPCRVNFSVGLTHTNSAQTSTVENQYAVFEDRSGGWQRWLLKIL